MRRVFMTTVVAAALMAPIAYAQQVPAPAAPAVGLTTHQYKVLVAGENPGIRLLDKEGGTILSQVSFWRAFWSPAGAGAICYVTVGDEKAGGLRIAITDNEKLLAHITGMFDGVAADYKTRPFKTVMGTITTTKWDGKERIENCKSAEYNVDLVWRDVDSAAAVMVTGQFNDSDSPGNPYKVNWVRIPARSGDIIVNGKKSPGSVQPTGQGPVRGSTASVIFGEDWAQ